MIYGIAVLILIALTLLFYFTIEKSVVALVLAIVTIIVGYFVAVATIARESEGEGAEGGRPGGS
ncbi:MAG: hypothetical protein GXO19_03285 [Epsilonproteobacteria bacterium]|nr:hypothetical protein [Campylobacterota bacterium]NPA56741.1 hypothetical protein [Campylobacterota bacterium]